MKYFEFKEPYYALIRADDEKTAVKLYISFVANLYEDESSLVKEISEDSAIGKYLIKYNETDSISEMMMSFYNNDVILVDGNLL